MLRALSILLFIAALGCFGLAFADYQYGILQPTPIHELFAAEESEIDFGTLKVGEETTIPFTLKNDSSEIIHILGGNYG